MPNETDRNPSGFDRIAPLDISLGQANSNSAAPDRKTGLLASPFWLGAFFSALVCAALIVILLLPGFVGDTPAAAVTNTPAVNSPPAAGKAESPYEEAEQAKIRKKAQDVLARLLDAKFQLDEMNAANWASEPYAAAVALAGEGDAHYRNRLFEAAMTAYQSGLASMEQILASREPLLEETLATGNTALAALDSGAAQQAFELALLIDPENSTASHGLKRAAVLDEIQRNLEQAQQLEQQGDISAALALLQNTAKLDAESSQVKQAIRRLQGLQASSEFQRQMSQGYADLGKENYATAIKSFRAALKLEPNSSEAADALKQAENGGNIQSIQQHQRDAEKFAASEQWQPAVQAYDRALAIDHNLLAISTARQQAETRARLDTALQEAISQPERLYTDKIRLAAEVLYKSGTAITAAGPRLQKQLTELQGLLQDAVTPVTVSFSSDQLSKVKLHKVSDMGSFASQQLELKPGTYVIVASRDGYRDARQEFKVLPRAAPLNINIQCTQPI